MAEVRPRPPSQGSLCSGSTLAKGQKPPQNLRATEGARKSRVEGSGWGGDLWADRDEGEDGIRAPAPQVLPSGAESPAHVHPDRR